MSTTSEDSCLCKTPNCTTVHSSMSSLYDGYVDFSGRTICKLVDKRSLYSNDFQMTDDKTVVNEYILYCEECKMLQCHDETRSRQVKYSPKEMCFLSDIQRKLALYSSNLSNFVLPKYSNEIQALEKYLCKYRERSKSTRRKIHTQCAELHSQVNKLQSKILKDLDQTETNHLHDLEHRKMNLISRKTHLIQLNLECQQKRMCNDQELKSFYTTQCSDVSLILPPSEPFPFIPKFKPGVMNISATENQIGKLVFRKQSEHTKYLVQGKKSDLKCSKYRKNRIHYSRRQEEIMHLNLEQTMSLVTLSD